MSTSGDVKPESTSQDRVPVPASEDDKSEPIEFGDPEFFDVTLIVDQQEFRVNKMFLANRSDVFKKMFFGETKEAKDKPIPIHDVTADGFRRFLEVIFCGHIVDEYDFFHFKKEMSEKRHLNANCQYIVVVVHHKATTEKMVSFWKCVSELLEAADRFNMRQAILDYLLPVISADICCWENCVVCMNYWIFTRYYGIDVPQQHRTFEGDTLKNWMKTIRPDTSNVSMDFALLYRILSKTRKIALNEPDSYEDEAESTPTDTVPEAASEADKPKPIQLGDPEISDVVLVVDQQEFHLHKICLASRSNYFKAMFCGEFKEAHEKRVELKDVPLDGFRRLLELLYNGSFSDRDEFLVFKREMVTFSRNFFLNEKESIASTHTATRSAIVHLVPEKKHIVSFWEGVSELLTAADLYNLEQPVLEHLKQVISDNICCKEHCAICFNYWIFAEQHGLDVPQKHRTFGGENLDAWFDAIGPYPTCSIPIDFFLMDKILIKTGKI